MPKSRRDIKEPSASVRWLIRAGTMAVSAAILFYYLRNSDWEELFEAARRADLVPALLGGTLPLFLFWFMDTAFTVKSFQWFHRPVRFMDYLFIKSASYLLAMVNVTFAAGGVFLYFMRKTGISATKQAGLLTWRVCIAVFGVVAFFAVVTAGLMIISPAHLKGVRLEIFGPVLLVLILVVIESGSFWLSGGGVVLKHLPVNYQSRFFSPFRKSRPSYWLFGFAYTVPPIVANFIGLYFVARAFHLEIPFFYFLYWMPIVAVLSALPVAFGGFGTTTAAWVWVFSSFGSQPDIWAATVFIPSMRLFARAAVSLVFMPLASRELESLKDKS